MKFLKPLTLLNAVAAAVAGTGFELHQGEDTFSFFPNTSGTVQLTLVIESLAPDGQWYPISAAVPYTTAGVQAPITISTIAAAQIRARVSAWTSGTITVTGYAGLQGL